MTHAPSAPAVPTAPHATGSGVIITSSTLPTGVSVVVPVFNSEELLPQLVERLGQVLQTLAARHELILVDDSSRDGSALAIRRLVASHRWVRGIELMRNFGQHGALLAGIASARYDVVVTMDDDLQNPPEEIHKLLAALETGADVVYGTPLRGEHSFWRNVASRVTKLALQSAMGVEAARQASAFRAFRTDIRQAFGDRAGTFASVDVMLTWGSSRFVAVPVKHAPRAAGRSNYSLAKLVIHALNMMTGYSTFPLQLASVLGFFFTLFGIGVLAWVIGRYFVEGGSIPGFPFLASIIAIFSGVQLFALGIFGEYLARMHVRTMGRPSSIVRARIEPANESEPRA